MSLISRAGKWIKRESGAIAPAFAIMLPAMLAMLDFSLESSNLMTEKAQVLHATDEASLAVAAMGLSSMTEEQLEASQALVAKYLEYFIPQMKSMPQVSIKAANNNSSIDGVKYISYEISAKVDLPLMLGISGTIESGELNIDTGTRKVKKYTSIPADYVFVVDFSTSQAGNPLKILKSVVKEVSEFALEKNENTKIAIVPFSMGVPVKLADKNERGGEKVACSVMFVPNAEYDINYAFWADKRIHDVSSKDDNTRLYWMDEQRRKYYYDYVRTASPGMDWKEVAAKWCVKNAQKGAKVGRAEYSCKTPGEPYTDLFSAESQEIIAREYDRAKQAAKYHYSPYYTIVNEKSIDYEATLERMFSDDAVINFPMPWTGNGDRNYRTFEGMCRNGGWYNHVSNNDLSRSTVRSWLIELTDDINKINEFQDMLQEGWTQTSSGLLRAVPVMAKGTNKRKVFVILSDGDDYPRSEVTNTLLEKYKVCDRIKEGLIERTETNTSRVDIYYISTNTATARVKYWADNCVGATNAKTSTTKDDLIRVIKGIITDETAHFSS